MQLLITFLTVVLVLNCVLLGLLVLIQLPKKEAGAGVAFGGGTTDALFGAGSGNALTKLTKYASVTFLVLSLIVGIMNSRQYRSGESEVRRALAASKTSATTPAPAAPAKPNSPFTTLTPTSTNLMTTTPAATTNAATAPAAVPAAPATNAPAPK
jgi:preprotein translocase subunit SecG